MSGQTFAVRISKSARQDLAEIVASAKAKMSASSANRLLDGLLDCVSTLERLPDRGSVPSELAQLGNRDFRQLIHQTYRLIYRVEERAVVVLVIADGRRDMRELLERRLLG